MTDSRPDVELSRSINARRPPLDQTPSVNVESADGIEQPILPSTDGGKDAWLALAGCSLIQAPVWGFPLCFGVFQEYYMSLEGLKGDKNSISNIGTSASGILYLSAPITFAILARHPHLRRYCGPVGLAIAIFGLILSSFATEVWQLVATQGVVCAIGSGLLYSPTTWYLDEWFIKRKGLAYGTMLASKSMAGVLLPFVMRALLDRSGFRTTMRIWAVASFVMTAPLLYFLKPRIPLATSTAPHRLSLDFLSLSSFWILQTGNLIQSLGYFLPSAYLASYASSIGLGPQIGTLMIALFNATSIPGSIVMGILNDRYQVTNVILVSTIGSTVAVFVFWGLADKVGILAVFAILYGFFAGGFSATWSGVMTQMKREKPALDTGLVFGLLAGARGIGNVASGPISSALVGTSLGQGVKNAHLGYETQYGWLIVFTGLTALFGGWGWGWRECR